MKQRECGKLVEVQVTRAQRLKRSEAGGGGEEE